MFIFIALYKTITYIIAGSWCWMWWSEGIYEVKDEENKPESSAPQGLALYQSAGFGLWPPHWLNVPGWFFLCKIQFIDLLYLLIYLFNLLIQMLLRHYWGPVGSRFLSWLGTFHSSLSPSAVVQLLDHPTSYCWGGADFQQFVCGPACGLGTVLATPL